MEALLNAFRSLGPARILALFVGIAAVIAISALVVNRIQTPGLSLLYGGLNEQEAGRITDYLATQNIAYETRADGSVYVPSDKVGSLRLQVAGQGLVGSSTAGYELFDNQSAFGTTSFVSNLNARRALEGELARTIATIPAVSGVRVHIVLPKQNLFSREQIIPSAAIALNLGPRTLDAGQVKSIAQLVAAAVPDLSAENITIIDQRGALLYDGRENNASASTAGTLRHNVEKSYEDSLTSMLERVVGAGKVSVRVTADLNLDKVNEQSELYDPTQQVVRSEQTIESTNASNTGNGGLTGVQGNTPGNGAETGGSSNSNENRTETTTNYEISKTVRTLNRDGGEVKKLSVAVLVSGKAAAAAPAAAGAAAPAEATAAYTPLTDDEKERLQTLVQAAIGFDAARGDKVEIIDMPFTAAPEAEAPAEPFLTKAQIINLLQYVLIVVALIVVALLVVRPALTTLSQAMGRSSAPLLPGNAPAHATLAAGAVPMALGGGTGATDMAENDLIDIRSVQGRVRESAVKKVNEIIDQYPEESLGVVRNWMGSTGTQQEQG